MLNNAMPLSDFALHWQRTHPLSKKADGNHPLPSALWTQYATPVPDPIFAQLKQENTVWQRIKKAFKTKSVLMTTVRSLVGKDLHANWDNHKQTLIQAFESADYQHMRCPLRKILKNLSADQLKELFQSMLEKTKLKPSSPLSPCLNLITLEELEAICNTSFKEEQDGIQMNAQIWTETLLSSPTSAKNQAKYSLTSVTNFVHCLLDTVLMAFRFFEMGKEPSSSWEASHFIQVYGQLLTFPVMLLTIISGFVASAGTALLITALIILLIVASVMVYVKWLKPCPTHIEPFENLTQAALDGKIKPVYCRDTEIADIVRSLTGSDETRSHPLLIGAPGVGKSEIVKGLAWKIAHNQIPSLKGKKVFSVNTSLLVNSFNHENKLQNAIKRIGKHGKDVILFLDETQAAFYQANKASLGDHLLTVLGTGPGSLPFCILATTSKGYQDYLTQEDAFIRRTLRVPIAPTDKAQTLQILREMLLREAPTMELSDSLFETIYTSSESLQGAQPDLSKRVLGQALSTLKMQTHSESPELQAKKREADDLYSKYKLHFHKPEGKTILVQLNAVNTSLQPLQAAQNKVNTAQGDLRHLEKQKFQQRNLLLSLAFRINKGKNTAALQELKKQYLFASQCFLPYIERELQTLNTKLKGFSKDSIDDAFIQQLVEAMHLKQGLG